jgi:hypothetical protein
MFSSSTLTQLIHNQSSRVPEKLRSLRSQLDRCSPDDVNGRLRVASAISQAMPEIVAFCSTSQPSNIAYCMPFLRPFSDSMDKSWVYHPARRKPFFQLFLSHKTLIFQWLTLTLDVLEKYDDSKPGFTVSSLPKADVVLLEMDGFLDDLESVFFVCLRHSVLDFAKEPKWVRPITQVWAYHNREVRPETQTLSLPLLVLRSDEKAVPAFKAFKAYIEDERNATRMTRSALNLGRRLLLPDVEESNSDIFKDIFFDILELSQWKLNMRYIFAGLMPILCSAFRKHFSMFLKNPSDQNTVYMRSFIWWTTFGIGLDPHGLIAHCKGIIVPILWHLMALDARHPLESSLKKLTVEFIQTLTGLLVYYTCVRYVARDVENYADKALPRCSEELIIAWRDLVKLSRLQLMSRGAFLTSRNIPCSYTEVSFCFLSLTSRARLQTLTWLYAVSQETSSK